VTPAEAQSDAIDCSVLVPVFNEQRFIVESVGAMLGQRFPGEIEFIFADGRSTDRTRELLTELARSDPRIRLIDNPWRTVSSGLNVALAEARGTWVARMDAHTRYPEDYLLTGVQRLQEGGTRWVSGPQVPIGTSTVSRAVALALSSWLGRGASRRWVGGASPSAAEYDLDTGVFTGVWPREELLQYGGWDERWVVNEDSEMAARFIENGERLVGVPSMAASYSPRDSLPALWRQYLTYGEYRAKTAARHPSSLRRSNLLPPALVLAAFAAASPLSRIGRASRALLALYGGAIVASGATSIADAESPADALLVPATMGVMHFAHGLGFLRGVVRHGAPLAALAEAIGLKGLATALTPPPQEVFAPSLRASGSARAHPRARS
jgi:succinoglycan biosynthesis protein ExoA